MPPQMMTPLGYIELSTGPKPIYPMNDIFLNYVFESPENWEILRLIVNTIIEAYKQAVTDTQLKPVMGTIEVKTQFKHFLEDSRTTRDQDLKMVEDNGSLTFIECQARATTSPPIHIRAVEYFGLGIGHNKGKPANQIWLLAEDVNTALQNKTFAHYILKDEATGHTHPATSGILYVSLEKLSQEITPAGEMAAFLLGKKTNATNNDVHQILEAFNLSFDNFKSDKDVVYVYSLRDRWLNEGKEEGREMGIVEGRVEGRVEGLAEGRIEAIIESILKRIKRNHPIEEIIEDYNISREYVESLIGSNM